MFECIPESVFGLPLLPLIGLVIGIVFAVNEAVRTKFRKTVLKVEANGQTIVFDNRYLVTAIAGVCVVIFTVVSVKDTGMLNPIPNNLMGLIVACMAGFTEGWAVIRVLNTRLDVFIKEKATESGATEEQAKAIADAVKFVEVEEKEEPKISFEEL